MRCNWYYCGFVLLLVYSGIGGALEWILISIWFSVLSYFPNWIYFLEIGQYYDIMLIYTLVLLIKY